MQERVKGFRERGFEMVQSGKWEEGSVFMFFEGREEGMRGMWVETIGFGEGEWPEAEEVWPLEGMVGGEEEKEEGKN